MGFHLESNKKKILELLQINGGELHDKNGQYIDQ